MDNYIVLECNKYGNSVLNEVSQVMTLLNYGGEWRAGNWEEEEVVEISGSSVWSASTTRMLISCNKENSILWDKRTAVTTILRC